MSANEIQQIVKKALHEDMPHGDITTDPLELHYAGRARLVAKEDLVLSGKEVFQMAFHELDSLISLKWQFNDGDFIFKNQTICLLHGNLATLLKSERVALNFLGRLSGIATLTRCFVDQVKHTQTKILDTRKTTPGLRLLEKMAVVHGGGKNHRLNLSTGVLVKENHIRAVGSLEKVISLLHAQAHKNIEVEVCNIDEVRKALDLKISHLLLDNMTDDELIEALKIIPSHVTTEASGNMTIERVARVAEIGVNYISVGALTHSAPCADMSLLFDEL